jgi:16S rRNA (uracil1498-N3)-methyltransferase
MRQFVLPPSWDGGPLLAISGKEARRLGAVLRLGAGDTFPALGPDGSLYRCTVQECTAGRILLSLVPSSGQTGDTATYLPDIRAGKAASISEPIQEHSVSLPSIFLGLGLLKGSKLDEVVRAATEAGVAAVVPLETERSIPRGEFGSRLERLKRLAREAIGQSGSTIPTRIDPVMSLRQFTAEYKPGIRNGSGLYFHETPLAESSIHRYCTPKTQAIFACVGPEGGFSGSETSMLDEAGFRPAWLGPAVLRAETAAIFAIASIRIICLERTSWSMTEYKE